MTAETRTFICPSDIVGIEYECGHCHARHLVPVERFDRVLYHCPNCKEGLATATDASSRKRGDDSCIHHFVEALREMHELTVKVRLEISGGLT